MSTNLLNFLNSTNYVGVAGITCPESNVIFSLNGGDDSSSLNGRDDPSSLEGEDGPSSLGGEDNLTCSLYLLSPSMLLSSTVVSLFSSSFLFSPSPCGCFTSSFSFSFSFSFSPSSFSCFTSPFFFAFLLFFFLLPPSSFGGSTLGTPSSFIFLSSSSFTSNLETI